MVAVAVAVAVEEKHKSKTSTRKGPSLDTQGNHPNGVVLNSRHVGIEEEVGGRTIPLGKKRCRSGSGEHAGMGGEIVEVEGGHIVRSRGRKDRHSKVCTAKGPRDRRVRLSAPTAIQFYDVQDRLGYDRPSKALDWLINKAKPAIDQLTQLPPWKPTLPTPNQSQQQQQNDDDVAADKEKNPNELAEKENLNNSHSGFVPFDTDIADTIRSFFPSTTSSSPIQFQIYPPDLLSRTSSQDLRLSLQSFQDPILHHNHNEHVHQHVRFTGTLDGMVAWNSGAAAANIDTGNNTNNDGGGGGFVFNAPSRFPSPSPAVMFGQGQYLSQRGPLQSSNTPSVRAWIDAPSFAAADHRRHCLSPAMMVHQSSSSFSPSGAGFASGGFSGFRVPARIRGEDEEEHGGVSDKPSSASSDSRR